MHSFPAPALALVEQMAAAAAEDPARAVAFQGAPGANSHKAALEWAPGCLPLPCFSFEDALDAVKAGRAGCAIIPIENSQHGRVADIHFLLPESGLAIVGEHFLPIRYAIMALGPGPFEAAYSHPQALGQTRLWLRERGIVPLSYADTAGAAVPDRFQGVFEAEARQRQRLRIEFAQRAVRVGARRALEGDRSRRVRRGGGGVAFDQRERGGWVAVHGRGGA
jgi:prephenate dehydratase